MASQGGWNLAYSENMGTSSDEDAARSSAYSGNEEAPGFGFAVASEANLVVLLELGSKAEFKAESRAEKDSGVAVT